jgi:hypothetical protein
MWATSESAEANAGPVRSYRATSACSTLQAYDAWLGLRSGNRSRQHYRHGLRASRTIYRFASLVRRVCGCHWNCELRHRSTVHHPFPDCDRSCIVRGSELLHDSRARIEMCNAQYRCAMRNIGPISDSCTNRREMMLQGDRREVLRAFLSGQFPPSQFRVSGPSAVVLQTVLSPEMCAARAPTPRSCGVFFSKQGDLASSSVALVGACIVFVAMAVRGIRADHLSTLALTAVTVLAVQQLGRSRIPNPVLAVCSTGSRAITRRSREGRPTR